MHGLGNDEAEVVGEAVRKPLMPVRGEIGMSERGLHPDVTIAPERWCLKWRSFWVKL